MTVEAIAKLAATFGMLWKDLPRLDLPVDLDIPVLPDPVMFAVPALPESVRPNTARVKSVIETKKERKG